VGGQQAVSLTRICGKLAENCSEAKLERWVTWGRVHDIRLVGRTLCGRTSHFKDACRFVHGHSHLGVQEFGVKG